MFKLFQKNFPGIGSVYYRGNLQPRPEEYSFLQKLGFEVSPGAAAPNPQWVLKLRHPKLGEADLAALRDFKPPPRTLLDIAVNLSERETEEAAAAGTGVTLNVPGTRNNILRDRKRFLCFLRAVMADDGVVAADHASGLFWSPAALQDETAHGADVDISALYCLHAVTPDGAGPAYWLHSHGLAEIGAVDFDIVHPSQDLLTDGAADALRALALAIAEGVLEPGGAGFDLLNPDGRVRLVPAAEFDRAAPADERSARDPEDHTEKRAVVCDDTRGFLGLGRPVRASRRFSGPIDDTTLIHFSRTATGLMAERARKTLPVMRKLMAEFVSLALPALAKIGYATDSGGPDSAEHLWFTVHEVRETDLDATLESSPFDIAGMRAGQRGYHPIDRLTDWAIMTPAGPINPRQMTSARVVRDNYGEIAAAIKAQSAG